jgi:hypothetical protein
VARRGDSIDDAVDHRRDAAVLVIDTRLETCIERVRARRRARGDARAFDPTLLTQKYRTIARLKEEKAEASGVRVLFVSDDTAVATIVGLLAG